MIFTKLELTNIGPHKSLTVNLNGHSVGIFGQNGAGKSFILRAIAFALRGRHAEKSIKSDDMIRTGEKSANVTLHFVHEGKTGVLSRDINGKRAKLDYNGETDIGNDDIIKRMTAMLGCDPDMLSKSTIINQGDTTKFLFGSPTEREALMSKIFGIGDMEKKELALGKLVKQYNQNIDVTLDARIKDAEVEFAEAEKRVDAFGNIELLEAEQDELKKNIDADSRIVSIADKIKMIEQLIEPNDANYKNGLMIIEECQRDLLTDSDLAKQKMILAIWNEMRKHSNLADMGHKYVFWQKNGATMEAKLVDMDKQLDQLREKLANYRADKILVDQHNVYRSELGNVIDKIQKNADEISELKKTIDVVRNAQLDDDTYNFYRMRLQYGSHDLADGAQCPLCGDGHIKPITDTDKQIMTDYVNDYDSKKRHLKLTDSDLASAENDKWVLAAEYQRLTELVNKSVVEPQIIDREEVTQAGKNLKTERDLLANEIYECRSAHNNYQAYLTNMAKITDDEKLVSDVDAVVAGLAEGGIQRHEKAEMMIDLRKKSIEKLLEDDRKYKQEIDTLKAEYENVVRSMSPKYKWYKMDELEEMHAANERKISDYKIENASKVVIRKRLDALLGLKAAQSELEKTCEAIAKIRSVFSRNGAPKVIINSVCNAVLEEMRSILVKMGSSMSISLDPDAVATFQFRRLDSPDRGIMGQNAMSGGEKVRVSLAFLLACQKVMMPQTSCLIVDEPSMHLDETGVDGLRTVLADIRTIMDDPDAQIIIVDHDHRLMADLAVVTNLG